jgi:hypothetical protein
MKILQSKEDGSCLIQFSKEEQEIIKEKGGLKMTAESLKHFSNVLVGIAVDINRNFDQKTKDLLTFDDTKIEGK